jgi:hypothetical protein
MMINQICQFITHYFIYFVDDNVPIPIYINYLNNESNETNEIKLEYNKIHSSRIPTYSFVMDRT